MAQGRPVIDPAKIDAWADRAGAHKNCISDNTAELTAFAALVRLHVIEECAQECDAAAAYYEVWARSDTASRIATVLRSWLPGG